MFRTVAIFCNFEAHIKYVIFIRHLALEFHKKYSVTSSQWTNGGKKILKDFSIFVCDHLLFKIKSGNPALVSCLTFWSPNFTFKF